MPTAETLINRVGGSQSPSAQQLWVVSTQAGQLYNIGFDKEFVKKHLFVDPDMNNVNVKANIMAGKANRYGNLQGPDMIGVPNNLDLATMRFLKMKKLVFSRMAQGKCSVCHTTEGQHVKLCHVCNHAHNKTFGGHACGKPDANNAGLPCICTVWDNNLAYRGGGVQPAQNCGGFVANEYELDRTNAGKTNPFGGSGGQCSGTNTSVLMNLIDVTVFRSVVADAVHAVATSPAGWPANQQRTDIHLVFGPGTVATIEDVDDFNAFSQRQTGSGISVDMKNQGGTYKIHHLRSVIA